MRRITAVADAVSRGVKPRAPIRRATRSNSYDDWLDGFRDLVGSAASSLQIERAKLGNLGVCRAVGDGVNESPGYGAYFVRRGKTQERRDSARHDRAGARVRREARSALPSAVGWRERGVCNDHEGCRRVGIAPDRCAGRAGGRSGTACADTDARAFARTGWGTRVTSQGLVGDRARTLRRLCDRQPWRMVYGSKLTNFEWAGFAGVGVWFDRFFELT